MGMKFKHRGMALLLVGVMLIGLLSLTACSKEKESDTGTITDCSGAQVEIAKEINRMSSLSPFTIYLIVINALGFILYLVNYLLYKYTPNGQIDAVLTIVSLLGGSLGIVIFILLFDRKPEKGNMMSRVFVACILVIQIVLFLIIKGHLADNITLAFWTFFEEHKALVIYLVGINFVTFAAFAVDKVAAIEHRSRIRIVTLLALAFFGGSVGAIIAMYLLRHKTKKDYFTVGVPLIMIMQVVLLFFAMNYEW